jgi:hypothetical protein
MDADRRPRSVALLLATVLVAPLGADLDQSVTARSVMRDPAHAIACGPHAAWDAPVAAMRVVSGEIQGRSMFGPGEIVIIDAGSAHGLEAGQEFFVRRAIDDQFLDVRRGETRPLSVRTAGWVRLLEVREQVSTARIVHACDSIDQGDYLEPFTLPADPKPLAGAPDYADPARLLMGDERRQTGAAGALMVLDRGSDHDVQAGQRLTVFRPTVEGGPVRRVAEATVVAVRQRTAMVRIDLSRDAVFVGDLVALHK